MDQLIFVISWLALLKFLQLAVWPHLTSLFGKLAYGVAWPLSLILFTIISWYCGLLGLPVQLAALPFVLLVAWGLMQGCYRKEAFEGVWHWDALFLLCFSVLLEVRFFNPSISFAEKFMDHAFLASVMLQPSVPPIDPWFAGGTLDVYYYLGYWMLGALGLSAGVPSEVVFNLALPTIFATAAVCLYALGHLLLTRFRWLPVLTLLLVNPSFVVHALAGENLSSVMWGSTRTIAGTINEFPLFSFLWGDVHPHVMGLFNQALLLFLLVFAYMQWNRLSEHARWLLCGCTALSLGTMPPMNSWDVLIYAPLVLCTGLLIWHHSEDCDPAPWRFLVSVPPLAVLSYLPFYLMLNTPGVAGVGLVMTPSAPSEFLLVNGFFILIFYIASLSELRKRPWLILVSLPFLLAGYASAGIMAVPLVCLLAGRKRPEALIAVAGFMVLILTEIVYLKDNMGETLYRMNTVFKLSLLAWMMMGPAAFTYLGHWSGRYLDRVPERPVKAMAIALVVLLVLSPLVIPDISYGNGGRTLDGLAWLEESHPGDAKAIAFLRTLEGSHVLVEAEGGDYKYYSRVSSLTGIPAVLGMPFHEQMWRGDETDVGGRMSDLRTIYESPEKAEDLMQTYGADLLYVGDAERERYDVRNPDALSLIYDESGVQIYQIQN